jgi:hypothetical protein
LSQDDYRKKYEELQQKYEEALKLIEALKRQLETVKSKKTIEIAYEQKSVIDKFIKKYLGDRPTFGGGSTLRWDLYEELIKKLFEEKDGDYSEFIRRFARMKGLTEKKLEYGYMKPLVDDGIIEVYYGNDGQKWRWVGGKIWKEIPKADGR